MLLGMQPYNRSLIKPFISGLLAALVAFLCSRSLDLHPLLKLAIGAGMLWTVYAAFLYFLKMVPEDLIVLRNMLSRFLPKLSINRNAAQ